MTTGIGIPSPRWQRLSTQAMFCLLFTCVTAQAQQDGRDEKLGGLLATTPITDFVSVQKAKVYHATRASGPVVIDGNIDEPAWQKAEVGGDFYQTDPKNGFPASEKTEFRIIYDDKNLYVSVVCYQQEPIRISELLREFAPVDGDQVVLYFDTLNDKKGGFGFHTNPGSALRDEQIDSVGTANANWDGIFSVVSRIQSPGWTAEFAIPFKTLRFDDSKSAQGWGFNIQRIIRYNNEWSQWSPAPRPFRVFEPSVAGLLTGIEGIHTGHTLYVKPYVLGNLQPHYNGGLQRQKAINGGLDVKYGVTSRLTLDLTANTDFSQVEVDQQQVNLTRFNLFFPEKRDFFLENLGLFDICSNVADPTNNGRCGAERDIAPFYSRSVGLSADGQPLPIRGGARLTGQVAGFDLGMFDMKVGAQGNTAGNNWTVARLAHNVLSGSQIGGFVLNRQSDVAGDWNRSTGLDGNFNFLRRKLNLSGFAMKSETPQKKDSSSADSVQANYSEQLYSLTSGYTRIDRNFQNDFGFVPRGAIQKIYNKVSFSPRPKSGFIMEDDPTIIFRHTLDLNNKLVTRFNAFGNIATFRDGATLVVFHNEQFDRLDRPFNIHAGMSIPVGDYHYNDWNYQYTSSKATRFFYNGGIRTGGFWSGTKSEPSGGAGIRINTNVHTSVTWDRNIVHLREGSFTADLIGFRVDTAFSPLMFLQTFIQYNTDARTVSSNVRYRFIHHPLSDFYVVYNEVRGINGNSAVNRILSLKLTHLLSF